MLLKRLNRQRPIHPIQLAEQRPHELHASDLPEELDHPVFHARVPRLQCELVVAVADLEVFRVRELVRRAEQLRVLFTPQQVPPERRADPSQGKGRTSEPPTNSLQAALESKLGISR